ncbi:hypothetical protein [Miniphocaeibacter massiliensis]|uniref:hypothetical protein n=1 Tax=Miniphocaeibacter massiliensis TaxID=2041841 RepID=UPI000C1BE251|nr:hypothetical protein [Miniphocaeibacter massiliensis]
MECRCSKGRKWRILYRKKIVEKPKDLYDRSGRWDSFKIYYNAITDEKTTEIHEDENAYMWIAKNREIMDEFYERNSYTRDMDFDIFKDENWKKSKPAIFRHISNTDILTIDLSTTALPKENKELYTRFPELKQYRDGDWRMVKIVFANELTAQEVVDMFTDES